MKKMFLNMIMPIRQKVININGRRSQTNKYQNLNLLFYIDMISLKDIESGLLKIDKKHDKEINIYYIGYITIKN